MTEEQIERIYVASFVTSLISIGFATVFGVLGVWGAITTIDSLLWKLLGTCGIVFAAAILTNLAVKCYTRG